MKRKFKLCSNRKGITLVELLVAVAVFVITVSSASTIFIFSYRGQTKTLAHQKLLDETSYIMDYMSRQLRMAKKELATTTPACLVDPKTNKPLTGCNYQVNIRGDAITFKNYQGQCQRFFLVGKRLTRAKGLTSKELKLAKNILPLTSEKLKVNSLRFDVEGECQEDYIQPKVTMFLKIQGEKTAFGRPEITIKTTISQRDLDIPIQP